MWQGVRTGRGGRCEVQGTGAWWALGHVRDMSICGEWACGQVWGLGDGGMGMGATGMCI